MCPRLARAGPAPTRTTAPPARPHRGGGPRAAPNRLASAAPRTTAGRLRRRTPARGRCHGPAALRVRHPQPCPRRLAEALSYRYPLGHRQSRPRLHRRRHLESPVASGAARARARAACQSGVPSPIRFLPGSASRGPSSAEVYRALEATHILLEPVPPVVRGTGCPGSYKRGVRLRERVASVREVKALRRTHRDQPAGVDHRVSQVVVAADLVEVHGLRNSGPLV